MQLNLTFGLAICLAEVCEIKKKNTFPVSKKLNCLNKHKNHTSKNNWKREKNVQVICHPDFIVVNSWMFLLVLEPSLELKDWPKVLHSLLNEIIHVEPVFSSLWRSWCQLYDPAFDPSLPSQQHLNTYFIPVLTER